MSSLVKHQTALSSFERGCFMERSVFCMGTTKFIRLCRHLKFCEIRSRNMTFP